MILDFATKYRSAAAITCTYTFLGHMAMQLFYKMKTQAEGTNSKLWLSRKGTTNGSHEWSHKSGPRMEPWGILQRMAKGIKGTTHINDNLTKHCNYSKFTVIAVNVENLIQIFKK